MYIYIGTTYVKEHVNKYWDVYVSFLFTLCFTALFITSFPVPAHQTSQEAADQIP